MSPEGNLGRIGKKGLGGLGKKMEHTTFSSSPVQQFTFHFAITLECDDSIANRGLSFQGPCW